MTPTGAGNWTYRLMATLCFGLFVSAMAFDALQPEKELTLNLHQSIWYGFGFGLPLLVGGVCLTGKRWTSMVGVMYGTIGLALDVATVAQVSPGPDEAIHFFCILVTSAVLNFFLILLGGHGLFSAS